LRSLVQIKAWSAARKYGTARYELRRSRNSNCRTCFWRIHNSKKSKATEEYSGYIWAAGGNLNTARNGISGAGTQTAGLAFGGYTTPGVVSNATEEYDGSTWTNGGNRNNTVRGQLAGCGTQTSSLAFGGNTPGGDLMQQKNIMDQLGQLEEIQ
jgi:hypothetical protein